MRKNIYQIHQIISATKAMAHKGGGDYVLLLWAISSHAIRQTTKGPQEESAIIADLREFVNELNDKYPKDDNEDCILDNSLVPSQTM